MGGARPTTTCHIFARPCEHIRWELTEMAQRLDEQPRVAELPTIGRARPRRPRWPSGDEAGGSATSTTGHKTLRGA